MTVTLPMNIVPFTLSLLFNWNLICYSRLCNILTNVVSEVRCTLTEHNCRRFIMKFILKVFISWIAIHAHTEENNLQILPSGKYLKFARYATYFKELLVVWFENNVNATHLTLSRSLTKHLFYGYLTVLCSNLVLPHLMNGWLNYSRAILFLHIPHYLPNTMILYAK